MAPNPLGSRRCRLSAILVGDPGSSWRTRSYLLILEALQVPSCPVTFQADVARTRGSSETWKSC